MKSFEIRHVVGFEETNVVGNVYYANHVRWQGRAREMFLREHVPEVLDLLADGLLLVTVRTACDYYDQLHAFDEVIIRMHLGKMVQNRVEMLFDYLKATPEGEHLVARGEQVVACMRREGEGMVPTPIPAPLVDALRPYATG